MTAGPAPRPPAPGEDSPDPREPDSPPPSLPPRVPPGVRRFVRWGLLGYGAVVGVLWGFTPLGFLDSAFAGALLELLPVLAVAQLPLTDGQPVERIPAYVGSGVVILLLGWIGLALGVRLGGVEGMGLEPPAAGPLAAWTAGTVAAVAVVVALFLVAGRLAGWKESPLLRQILPRTGREKGYFVALCFAAGLGEELAFRGYAILALTPVLGGEWAAAALSSGAFGFLHAYQGGVGIVRTASMGMVLAAAYLLSGSLWVVILAHVVVDLLAGLVVGERVLPE